LKKEQRENEKAAADELLAFLKGLYIEKLKFDL
jgi:hypothetical protein